MIDINNAKIKSNEVAVKAWEDAKNYFKNNNINALNKLGNMPVIRWKKFGFLTAGRFCCYMNNQNRDYIEMNTNFLTSPDAEKFITSTTLHEIAHTIAYRVYNTHKHDYTWKKIAQLIGDDGERCHDYAPPANSTRKIYVCNKCGAEYSLSPTIVKRSKKGGYRCSTCHNDLINFVH